MLESRLPRIVLPINSNHLGAVLVTPEHPYSRAPRRQGSRSNFQASESRAAVTAAKGKAFLLQVEFGFQTGLF